MAKAMKIEYIDVSVQNGWNRDIKKGRQSILKSILNQHNTQSKSSRYFKIIERCSNGLLHTYPYTHCVSSDCVSSGKIRSGQNVISTQRKEFIRMDFRFTINPDQRREEKQKTTRLEYIAPKWWNQIWTSILLDACIHIHVRHYPFQYLRKCVKPFWLKAKVFMVFPLLLFFLFIGLVWLSWARDWLSPWN